MQNNEVLTVEEAAALLRLSKSGAYQAIHEGQIDVVKIGRRILIPRAVIERMLASAAPILEASSKTA